MQHRRIRFQSSRRPLRRLLETLETRQMLAADTIDSLWNSVAADPLDHSDASALAEFASFRLNRERLQNHLESAPPEFWLGPREPDDLRPNRLHGELSLPMPDGRIQQFELVRTTIVDQSLAQRLPQVATYSGLAIDGAAANVRVTVTPDGMHAQIRSTEGVYFVNPMMVDSSGQSASTGGDDPLYRSYYLDAVPADPLHDEHADASSAPDSAPAADPPLTQTTGDQLRTYRLAVAATGEFTARHGGTIAGAQAAIITAINDANGLYEQEMGIRFQLVDNSSIIYLDAATDPYTNSDNNAMLNENQINIDAVIGDANYDVGHVFGTDGGGLAFVGVAGRSGQKARGVSSNNLTHSTQTPAHELGHQFNSRHTWNGANGYCSASQWNADFSMEPGSGSTLMSYGGFCGSDNVQSSRDFYFHSVSYDAIVDYVTRVIPGVGTISNTGNTAPDVSAGPDYTIPAATPFELNAPPAVDQQGDVVTYNWEQRDLGSGQKALSDPDDGLGPLFRSYPKSTDLSRTLPRLGELLNNTAPRGEQLPTTNRQINFRLNANDSRGGTASDSMVLNVVDTGTPFAVTSPNSAVDWLVGTAQTVTWDVAGTNANGIDVAFVEILLSTDGGNQFDTVLASGVENDGSQSIVVPEILTSSARVKVQAIGNIFFDLSNTNFSIIEPVVNVESVVVNDASASRSQLTSLTVQFDGEAGATPAAFEVRNRDDQTLVATETLISDQSGVTVATITFLPGPNVVTRASGNSLVDGNYQLRVVASGVDRLPADFQFGDLPSDQLFRLFGDSDGDRDVDGHDYGRFAAAFLLADGDDGFQPDVDFEGDGDVDSRDYGQLSLRWQRVLNFQ
ncbi:M12 family metallo-peptidase [Stieleria sp. TO1_6]|uniref:reprolysin-like metallopeptidase n=1 Tax=Stieleria tagensis TaxID=2956795 RepID=UPI00209B75BD|nr:M12 family metallo-peptidase [Stieleria tagensis]MCO8122936.1 M12 family metallo-peptidase [Stieleria tagensis]